MAFPPATEEGVRREKARVRRRCRARREALSPEESARLSEEICRRVAGLDAFRKARTVLLYAPIRAEADTGPLAREARRAGKRLLYPRVSEGGKELELREVRDPVRELRPGRFGVLEPDPGQAVAFSADEVGFMAVPGVAFDREGRRLGFGKGFYDRLLRRRPAGCVACGLAYSFQVVDRLPAGAEDQPVDWVVSEREAVRCVPGPGRGGV